MRPKGPVINKPGRQAGIGLRKKRAPKVRHSTAVPALQASSVRPSLPELRLGAIHCRPFAPQNATSVSIHFRPSA
jgi:hypothetical protein